MNKKLVSLYGLKWNPLAAAAPVEALYVSPLFFQGRCAQQASIRPRPSRIEHQGATHIVLVDHRA